jgi:hypothetical protein
LNSAGVNLNWARTKLGEKEKQLSSQYDSDHLKRVAIFWKSHDIPERYYFCARKLEVGLKISIVWDQRFMYLGFYVF